MKALFVLLLASVLVPLVVEAKGKPASKTLYDDLGKKQGIVKVVDDFVGRCAADERIKSYFAEVAADKKRLSRFKGHLVDQICQASGGPCKYKGKDMKTAHAGMGITEEHFNAVVENLSASLDKFKVSAGAKSKLLWALGPMKADIVAPGAASAQLETGN